MFPIASKLFYTFDLWFKCNCNCIHISCCANARRHEKVNSLFISGSYGLCYIGIFTITQQGIEGSIFQMISHGLVSAALFLCVGVIYDRMHTRDIDAYGGVINNMPSYALVFLFFTMANVGLPGTSVVLLVKFWF